MEPPNTTTAAPVLSDGVVTLRPWRPDDAQAVFDACQDPLIALHTYVPVPYTVAHAEGFIAICTAALTRGSTGASFAITDTATDQVLGSMSRFPLDGHRASFGYWLAPEARGRGVATRALRLIADWTLATTEAIRLELYTDLDNPASGAVAERAGFVREGIRRAWDIGRDGQPIDVIFYVLVRPNA
jgi:RimJ/RimL family protein N-acetyltransferase